MTGIVQGVGFRPMVWRVARAVGVYGDVINDGEGVLINAWAGPQALDLLCQRIAAECPPLARIDAAAGESLEVDIRGRRMPVRVVSPPCVRHGKVRI